MPHTRAIVGLGIQKHRTLKLGAPTAEGIAFDPVLVPCRGKRTNFTLRGYLQLGVEYLRGSGIFAICRSMFPRIVKQQLL